MLLVKLIVSGQVDELRAQLEQMTNLIMEHNSIIDLLGIRSREASQ